MKDHGNITGTTESGEGAVCSVRILVATHKRYRMPQDPIYLPMWCGAALDPPSEPSVSVPDEGESAGTQGIRGDTGAAADPRRPDGTAKDLYGYARDDLGDNISSRNPTFCELTALYWAWKHIDADYIGLVHYRRYFRGNGRVNRSGIRGDIFDHVMTCEELEPLLGRYLIFVPRRRHYVIETIYSHYEHSHYADHLDRTRNILRQLYPEYLPAFDDVMAESSAHMFNMMIMERGLLDEYCTWLFDILMALEAQVDTREYSYYQGRYAGRVGEIIFNVWLRYQVKSGRIGAEQVKTLPYLYLERIDWGRKFMRFLRAKFLHEKYEE